jgi:hypothetical protein
VAADDAITFVVNGQLWVHVMDREIVRLGWPEWKENIHWAVGTLTEESAAGRALLAAAALHGEPEDATMPHTYVAAEPVSMGDLVVSIGPGVVIRRAA